MYSTQTDIQKSCTYCIDRGVFATCIIDWHIFIMYLFYYLILLLYLFKIYTFTYLFRNHLYLALLFTSSIYVIYNSFSSWFVIEWEIILNISNRDNTILLETRLLFVGACITVARNENAQCQSPPFSVLFFCSCNKVYHKQEVRFLLYKLCQIVTDNHNSNTLD